MQLQITCYYNYFNEIWLETFGMKTPQRHFLRFFEKIDHTIKLASFCFFFFAFFPLGSLLSPLPGIVQLISMLVTLNPSSCLADQSKPMSMDTLEPKTFEWRPFWGGLHWLRG